MFTVTGSQIEEALLPACVKKNGLYAECTEPKCIHRKVCRFHQESRGENEIQKF